MSKSITIFSIQKVLRELKKEEEKSQDPRTKVGCILTDGQGIIVARGHNRLPVTLQVQKTDWSLAIKNDLVIHAEMVAILTLVKLDHQPKKLIAWISHFPCKECAKILIDSGIKKIKYRINKYPRRNLYVVSKKILSRAEVPFSKISVKTNHPFD